MKMNYETATDFELNKRLAELYLPCDYIINNDEYRVELANYQDVMVGEIHDQVLTPYAEFNPCNNWNDIMPIAVELGVEFSMWSNIDNKELWIASKGSIHHSGKPQRALVICCIKVLEAQANEKK